MSPYADWQLDAFEKRMLPPVNTHWFRAQNRFWLAFYRIKRWLGR